MEVVVTSMLEGCREMEEKVTCQMGVVDYTYYTNLLSSTQEAEAGL
jgi:hypothetical protein